jgi:outer membrane protein assembly factor BamD
VYSRFAYWALSLYFSISNYHDQPGLTQMNKFTLYTLTICALLLSACSSNDKDVTVKQGSAATEKTAAQLYNDGLKAMKDQSYGAAIVNFENVERQYPYSEYATDAQLLAGKAAYEGKRYDDAIIALDRFIELHPGNDQIDYAYYLQSLCYYEQISDVSRDQQTTKDALSALDTLIKRFPNSPYSRDAQLKRDLTLDHLAGKEMEIGRYYLTRGYANASINRFLTVVRNYQTTTHIPEALYRLVEAYLSLGIEDEALRVASILAHNYPGNKWYESAYKILDPTLRDDLISERSWLDRTVDSLLAPE